MDNFDLKKYLAEGRLFEEANPIWVIDAFDDSADIEQAGPVYKEAVIDIIKSQHPDISDKDLEASIEVMNVTWYNEARSNAKGSEPEEMKVSAEDFADGVVVAIINKDKMTFIKSMTSAIELSPPVYKAQHRAGKCIYVN